MAAAALSRLFTILAVLFVFAVSAPAALAQQADAPAASSDTSAAANAAATAAQVEEQLAAVRTLATEVDTLENRMRNETSDDTELVAIRNELEALSIRLDASRTVFAPRLQEINHRLDQIGPPGDDNTEPEALKEERTQLLEEKADINAFLGEVENLGQRIDRLTKEIAQIRRDLFARQLTKRYNVSDALSFKTLGDFVSELERLRQTVGSWLQFILRFKLNATLLAGFISFAAAAVLFYGGRRLFGSLIFADPLIEEPSYLSRLSVAFWSTLLPSLALAVFLGTSYALMAYFDILWPDIARMLSTFFNVVATVFLVNRLAHALFSPGLPNWSLIPVAPGAARKLYWFVWVTSIATGFDFIFSRVNDVLGSPLSLTVAKSLVATFVVGVLVILIALVRPFRQEDGSPKAWPRWLIYPLLALGLSTILAGALGYIGLARFISQQIVVTGAILATMYIGHMTARAVSDLGAIRKTAFGQWLDRNFESNQTLEDQLGLLFSVSINLMVVAIGIPLILLQWGFQWGDITTWALRSLRQIQIGSVSFSILDVLTGILVFVIGYFVTRWFQRWLDGSVMTRGRVDAGVRNSIKTVVGYTGIAIAILIGVSAAGINLSSLALVAGGLSLGVGFGLQNIVSNFVSGLILLVERPFKSGDWIVAGGVSGTVKKISVRATEIETFQRQSVILPNSELINSAVGDWTHRNRLGRIDIPIGVSYDANPRRVHAILTEIAAAHPTILKNPEPMVVFKDFGDSSLNFEIRFFLADVMSQLAIQNDIRFAIYDRLKEEEIEIPFPQRDLHIRTGGLGASAAQTAEKDAKDDAASETDPKKLFPGAEPAKPKRRRKPRGHAGDE
ncbi:MAG: mechanosensitive ion channel family protein [Rhizobiaceae bacterium]